MPLFLLKECQTKDKRYQFEIQMMTDEHNFIMLMETPNAIETEKKY